MNLSRMVFLLVVTVAASGCVKHQYLTVDSQLPVDKKRGYVIENDSLEILYRFKGTHGPVTVELRNKSQNPVYIDWTRSALIYDGKTIPYMRGTTGSITAKSTSTNLKLSKSWSVADHAIDGVVEMDPTVEFVAPQSVIRRTLMTLRSKMTTVPRTDKIKIQGKIMAIRVRKNTFSKEDSPLKFRSFLTLYNYNSPAAPSQFDNEFWVGSIYEARQPLDDILENDINTFNVSKFTGTGTMIGAAVAAGVVTILVVSADDDSPE